MYDISPMTNPKNDLKVIVLGDSEAGKSLLISRILNDGEMPEKAESWDAAGISIKNIIYGRGDQAIRVNFWGFSGLAIRNSMHQVFLTKRAIYLIVVSVRDDSQEERARFWLNTVKMAAPEAPVLLVLNKIDLNPNAAINESDLRSKYPNLCEIVRVSAAKDNRYKFYATFGSVLMRQIYAEASYLCPQPEAWHFLRDELSKKDFRYIGVPEFNDLCDVYGITPNRNARSELLQWLSDAGVVFLLQDGNGRIYRTAWIVEALLRVQHIPVRDNRNGIIPHEELIQLLCGPGTDNADDDVHNLLHVMRCFSLSMRINDSLEFLPMLCDRNTKPIAWEYREDDTALEFRADFEYLPSSVIHRLMVRYIVELDTNNIWYSGARFMFDRQGASALVQSEGNSVVVYVRCDETHEPMIYVQSMMEILIEIGSEYGLRLTDQKAVYKRGGLRDVFSYDMLKGSVNAGIEQVYSVTFEGMISIKDILNPAAKKKQTVSEKLLLDIAQACESVQGFFGTANRTEDDLNAVLRKALWQKGHLIADHRLLGLLSRTGKRTGEVDLLLIDKNRKPLTMIEAMRMQSMGRTGLRYWEEHLSQLLIQYSGIDMELSVIFQINYAECRKDKYDRQWDMFREHMRWHDPERMKRKEGTYSEIWLENQANPYLRAAKCDYDFRGRTITVYQYFVWVEPGSGHGTRPDRANPFRDVFDDLPKRDNDAPKKEPGSDLQQPAPVPEESRRDTELASGKGAKEDELARKEYRVVFLGDSEAGKSQLLARVMDPQKGLEQFDGMTTPGISIEHQFHDFNGIRVRVNFWDFGGQEILHSLHRMFLSVDTLYVIVLNTRNDNHDAQADFWMRYVQSYAYGAPVLLVLNKIDQNPKAKLNLPVLNRHFSKDFTEDDVLRICAIDKEHEKFRQKFTEKLLARIAVEAESCNEFSDQEATIRAAVEKHRNTSMIKADIFRDICEKAGLGDTDSEGNDPQEQLMNRFHQAGILVYFGTELKMLLDPRWITKAIYVLLEKQDEIADNGIVRQKKLEKLCYKELDDSEHAKFILEVMRFYGLSYQYKTRDVNDKSSENMEFIPMLCRQEEPLVIHEMTMENNTIEMQMHFEYLPTGVLYQLMVKFADYLDSDFVWRSGARFKFGSLISAIVRRDANVMQIYVHYDTVGVKARALEYMKKLMDETSVIAERGKATAKLLEIKLGYMVGTIQEFFDYNRLEKARAGKVYYVASKVRDNHRIYVDDILNQEDGWEAQTVNKLLTLSLDCARELQGTQTYWFRQKEAAADKSAPKMGEDQRTHLFKVMLKDSFTVSEQPRWGASASGVSSGELDLQINTKDGDMLAILEALNITGDNKTSRDNWKEHLSRMMDCYNQNGLRHLLLVSYLDCDKEKVGAVQDAYLELLRTYEVPKYGAPEEIITDVLPNCPNEIQVVQADYYTDTGVVSVYHFLIHISRYIGQNEIDKKPSDTKDNQKTT